MGASTLIFPSHLLKVVMTASFLAVPQMAAGEEITSAIGLDWTMSMRQ